jgi:hypothetical protein
MRVCANLPVATRDVRLDLFRGLANWAIFLDHIPHEILSSLTTRNYGFSDAADLFVFISGYTAAMVFGKVMIERGYLAAALRLARRAFQLYAAHMAVVAVYIAVIAWVSREFHDPDDLTQFNVAVFISMPLREFIQALALRYRPVNLDVLPLYILLLGTFAPALWLMIRQASLTLTGSVAGSSCIWLRPSALVVIRPADVRAREHFRRGILCRYCDYWRTARCCGAPCWIHSDGCANVVASGCCGDRYLTLVEEIVVRLNGTNLDVAMVFLSGRDPRLRPGER